MVKLGKIEIKNYKSCQNTVLEINDGLTVLVGVNGAGKTNILNAVQLFSLPVKKVDEESIKNAKINASSIIANFNVNDNQVELTCDFTNNHHSIFLSVKHSWRFESMNKNEVFTYPINEIDGETNMIDFLARNKEKHLDPDNWLTIKSNMIMIKEFLYKTIYYSSSEFSEPYRSSMRIEPFDTIFVDMGNENKYIYDLYIRELATCANAYPDIYESYLNIIGPNGLHLLDDLSFFVYDTDSGNKISRPLKEIDNLYRFSLVPRIKIGNTNLGFNQLSTGTFRTLALLFYLISDHNGLLIFEEPEIGIHHGLLNSIIEITKNESRSRQIIFSTHSDFVLDKLEPNDLVFVTNGSDGTKAQKLSSTLNETEKKALHGYLENEGSLGQYWKEGGFENE